MKKAVICLLVLLIFSLLISGCTTSQVTKTLDAKEKTIVTKIVDGDTIITQGGEHVRLLGVDTPEKGEPYYSEAKEYLNSRIFMKEVYLESDVEDKDQYDRLLRYIWFNDSLINLELVENGLAIARFYDNMKYKEQIQAAESQAIQSKLGIWSQLDDSNNANTIPENQLSINSTIPLTEINSDDDCISLGCPQGTQYVASKNSEKYHRCSCSFAKRISQENIICFASKEEAEQNRQGCSSCKP